MKAKYFLSITFLLLGFYSFGQQKDTVTTGVMNVSKPKSGIKTVGFSKAMLDSSSFDTFFDTGGVSFTALEFDIMIVRAMHDPMFAHVLGNNMETVRSMISKARLGDNVYFENIKCKKADGSIMKLKALSFVIQ